LTTAAKGAAIDARLAHLAFVTGDPAKALALARSSRDAAVVAADDPHSPDLAFYEYQLGEIARLTGDPLLAGSAYRSALIDRPDDLGSLVGLARVEAHDDEVLAAIAGLRRAAAIAPQPDTLALLGDLLAESGGSKGASQQYAAVRAIRSLSELAGSVYDRQLLLFELDHGGASEQILDRARQALGTRGDVYGHDVVAWAQYRLGRAGEAKVEMAVAMAQHTPDARLLYHAGAIELATGDTKGATGLLRQALSLSSGLDPLQLAEAQHLLAAATV
jgi:tetratricopeptide (TPR) repeat protein